MPIVYAGQIRIGLRQIVRRSDGPITREELVEDAVLEMGIDPSRAEEELDELNRRGEVYHVDIDGATEVRVP